MARSSLWRLLRLALLLARRGRGLTRVLVAEFLRIGRRLAGSKEKKMVLYYGEQQLTFDSTPVFGYNIRSGRSVPMRVLRCIACLRVDEDKEAKVRWGMLSSSSDETRGEVVEVEEYFGDVEEESGEEDGDEGIDAKATEFIKRFYKQLKLQRQLSLMEFNE